MFGNLFGGKILHRLSPAFQTFFYLFVLNPSLRPKCFARPSCERLAKRGGVGSLDKRDEAVSCIVWLGVGRKQDRMSGFEHAAAEKAVASARFSGGGALAAQPQELIDGQCHRAELAPANGFGIVG